MHNCKVRIIKYAEGVFPEYQPEIGKVYDAKYWKQASDNMKKSAPRLHYRCEGQAHCLAEGRV